MKPELNKEKQKKTVTWSENYRIHEVPRWDKVSEDYLRSTNGSGISKTTAKPLTHALKYSKAPFNTFKFDQDGRVTVNGKQQQAQSSYRFTF